MTRHERALEVLKQGTVIPAVPLALNKNRQLDERRQRALIRYYLDSGCGGVAVAVHTTQFEIRRSDVNLFEPILALVSEEIDSFEKTNNRTIVKIAGVCGDTDRARTEAKLALQHGYDAGLLSPGGLAWMNEAGLVERTRAVAEIIPVIGFYLQPSVGGRVLGYNYWTEIAEIKNVVAIKAAPFNRYAAADVVRAVAFSSRCHDIVLYTGNDDNLVVDLLTKYTFHKGNTTITKEFAGGILGHWAVWTSRAVEIFHAAKSRENFEMLLALANEVTDVNAAFFDAANNFKGCIAGLHEVLRRQGFFEGIWCLNGDCLSPGQTAEIDRVYRQYPHLNDDEFVKNNLIKWML
jgi:dihydrodipicolinate synthase/N-acetylneuraminate lyase